MKKKTLKIMTAISAVAWAVLAIIVLYGNEGFGAIATLAGISSMFAWTYFQLDLKD